VMLDAATAALTPHTRTTPWPSWSNGPRSR
jgi:hypothetical protein